MTIGGGWGKLQVFIQVKKKQINFRFKAAIKCCVQNLMSDTQKNKQTDGC